MSTSDGGGQAELVQQPAEPFGVIEVARFGFVLELPEPLGQSPIRRVSPLRGQPVDAMAPAIRQWPRE
jgi:hypothetical protein